MTAADWAWVLAPLAALVAACIVLVPLGAQVLARGVVFIDLAVAQVAACGALAVAMVDEHAGPGVASAAAAVAALAGAALVWWLARRWPDQREALIGLIYVAAAGAAVIGASFEPHGRERLAALLAADVLWASGPAITLLALAAAPVALLAFTRRAWLARDRVFYPVFALALSAAVPVLGLYLVFALLIGPALWTRRGLGLGSSLALALGACVGGLALSWGLDWPSGACLALVACALGLASVARRPARVSDAPAP